VSRTARCEGRIVRTTLLLLLVAACGSDVTTPMPDAPVIIDPGVKGTIDHDTTWSGSVDIVGAVTIPAGVTVTVMPGTQLNVKAGTVEIDVDGKVDIQGTSTGVVKLLAPNTNGNWRGFVVTGQLVMHYADQTNGGIVVTGGGTLTAADSIFSHDHDSRDFLVMEQGMVDVSYSTFAAAPTHANDQIHCDMHANPGETLTIKVTHSNIEGAQNGLDFYGGTNADLTYNNWFTNSIHLYTEAGSPVSGDVSFGFFEGSPPVAAAGSSLTAQSLASSKLTDAGPRP
jgi:hypothetical protein